MLSTQRAEHYMLWRGRGDRLCLPPSRRSDISENKQNTKGIREDDAERYSVNISKGSASLRRWTEQGVQAKSGMQSTGQCWHKQPCRPGFLPLTWRAGPVRRTAHQKYKGKMSRGETSSLSMAKQRTKATREGEAVLEYGGIKGDKKDSQNVRQFENW